MKKYVIIYKKNYRRVRIDGVLTPVFDYPTQALKYIDLYLQGSKYLTVYEV